MAYGVKYRFTFDSQSGSPFRIDILKDGYSGSVLSRAVGEGSPVIRRDKSDVVCGTSLEIPGECSVDNEFEEFKSSVPFTFQARVYGGVNYGTLIWVGHVTPELMEAPDIAPPYDVQISCTDGLGELKYTDFAGRSGDTLWSHLTYLLSLTGLDLDVTFVNDITHGSYDAQRLLHETVVNLDFLAGKTCYEVLGAILASLHASITQYNGTWLVFRETAAQINTSVPSIGNAYVNGGRNATPIPVDVYGTVRTHRAGWWPVGHMTHGNVPPRKGMTLTSENHYAPNILSDAVWQSVANGEDEGGWWSLPAAGDGMRNMGVSFDEPISQKLILSIRVRNIGSGTEPGKLSLKVKAVGRSYSGTATYYLSNGTYGRRNPTTDFGWSTTEQDSVIEVQAPAETDTDDDYIEFGIVLPIYRASERSYFYCSSLEVTICNGDGLYAQRVYGVTLSKYEQFAGFRKEIFLDNGARGRGGDVDLAFTEVSGGNDYAGTQELQLGVLMDATSYDKVSVLKSSTFTTAMDYLSLMARDYALSVAGARRSVRGSLNVPVGHARIPVAFRDDHDGTYFFIDTLSWDLIHDEMSVEMTSRPVTAISVEDEVDEIAESGNATGHQQAQSSGGGGGGGGGTGTVTSVELSIPTYFDISGSPVTVSGTLTATLKSSYVIPTLVDWSAMQEAVGILTAANIANWNAGGIVAGYFSNGVLEDGHGGTGYSSYNQGDILYGTQSGLLTKLTAPNISGNTKRILRIGSDKTPAWAQLAATDVFGSSAVGSTSLPIFYDGSDLDTITSLDLLSESTGYVKAKRFYLTSSIYFYTETVSGTVCVRLNAPLITEGDQIVISGTPGGGGGGGVTTLQGLDDTLIPANPSQITDGYALVFDRSDNKWKPGAVSSGGGAVTSVVGQTGAVTAAQIGTALDSEGYDLTDENVKQTATSDSSAFRVLLSGSANNTTLTEGVKKSGNLTYNPSTKALLTGGTVDGLALAAGNEGFTITGGTLSRTLTVRTSYTLGAACEKAVTDSSSASAIGTGTSLPTERDIYYGLPTINGSHSYTSSTNIYAPTSAGTSGYWLKSSGSGAPSWESWSNVTVGKATADGDGNTISSTYLKLSGGTMTGAIRLASGSGNGLKDGSGNDILYYSGTALSLNFSATLNLRASGTAVATLSSAGMLTTSGDQVISSDLALKTNLKDITYGVEAIAGCRAVTFDWKCGGGRSAGSIAQDWKGILPELVHGEEGGMSLAYGQLALVNTIIIARHETEQDREIRELRDRVAELERRLGYGVGQ